MKKANLIYLITASFMTVTALYICDQVLAMRYFHKVLIKIILFAAFPVLYRIRTGENILRLSFVNSMNRVPKKRRINIAITLGILTFVVLMIAQYFVMPFIDTNQLITEFDEKYRINQSNIIYYSIYLVFLNSFLEEFFFRGFVFLGIKRLGFRKTAYLISASLFAVYHIANFQNWLNLGVITLALSGLFIGGLIFNGMDDRQETFLNSWFVHICADIAIVLMGLVIFEVI